MKISQKRKEKKERKERLYRPRTEGERAAARRATLYALTTVFFCLVLIFGAIIAITLAGEGKEEIRESATESTEAPHTYTVVIDPGHGGGNMGDLISDDLAECDYTMSLADEIAEILRDRGCRVIFTRTSDITEPIPDEERVKAVTEGDCMISLHTCVQKGVYYSLLSDTTEYSGYLAKHFGSPIAESEHIITRPKSVPCVLLGVDEETEAEDIAEGIMEYLKRFVK